MSNRKWVRIFCRWIFNKGCFLHLLMLLLIAAINSMTTMPTGLVKVCLVVKLVVAFRCGRVCVHWKYLACCSRRVLTAADQSTHDDISPRACSFHRVFSPRKTLRFSVCRRAIDHHPYFVFHQPAGQIFLSIIGRICELDRRNCP
jgi:hypothetical protein